MSQKIVIQLGKLGDLMLLLPALKAEADAGNRCALMVAEKYAPLLEGVSYVDVIPFKGHHLELRRAWTEAQKLSPLVTSVQVMGPTDEVKQCSYRPAGTEHAITDSFAKEPWRLLGQSNLWKTHPPLVFDHRNEEREREKFKKIKTELGYNRAKGTELVLVNVDGETSPFQYRELLMELLNARKHAGRRIVDLSGIRVERLYDLLALYEIAHCLISVDSAPLHLARAVPSLPVIALCQDKPSLWHGSPWRPNHVFQCRYVDFPAQAVTMLDRLDAIGGNGCITRRQVLGGEFPRILHVYPGSDITADNRSAHRDARRTWAKLYAQGMWTETPIDVGACGRDSKSALKDDKRFPFLKDVIRLAAQRASDLDIICLTRGVTALGSAAMERILKNPFSYSHRLLLDGIKPTFHPSVDIFCFPKSWWIQNRSEIPDFVLGNDIYWPRALMEVMKKKGAVHLEWLGDRPAPAVTAASVRPKAPRVAHNEKLAEELLRNMGSPPLFPMVAMQQKVTTINRHALAPFGYNPSLTRHDGRLLMAYRSHTNGPNTSLFMAELNDDLTVAKNSPIQISANGMSVEDARLFPWQGALWMSFQISRFESGGAASRTHVARLVPGNPWTIRDVWTPEYGRNDGTGMEKNWVFFAQSERLFAIYSQGPEEQLTLEFGGGKVIAEHRTESLCQFQHGRPDGDRVKWPHWVFGSPKGGTAPIPFNGNLLRFFHSTLDNEPAHYRRRYYVGAVKLKPEPPFDVIEFSSEPLLYGSEDDVMPPLERSACSHWKGKVIFPAGAVWENPEKPDSVLLSVGVNDSQCAIARINRFKL